jgi:hypothetical protein
MSRRVPSAFVGRMSLALTMASVPLSMRALRRARFSVKSVGSIGA